MSWEKRGNGGPYYTRSHRRGGKITREYVGTGDAAVLFAEIDALKRQEREADLDKLREQKAADQCLDATLDEFCRFAEAAARAELLAAGYHSHKGQWRKRRVNGT